MARNNPIPFIPKQPQAFQASRRSQQASALLGNVGALVSLGTNLQLQQQQKANVEQEARLKIESLNQAKNLKADQVQKQEAARELQRTEQSAALMARQFEQASREIQQREKQGIYAVVNGLNDSQIRSANARGLGFTTPEAIELADRALGERQANLDFPRLLESIAMDESKLPSEHLASFLNGQNMGSELGQVAYAATLTDRINVYEKNAILKRAKKSQAVAQQNAIDGFQFNIVEGFETLDKTQFQTSLSALYRGLKSANKDITEAELKQIAVGALEPLFVGSEARFSAGEGLLKLQELFTEDELERFGLGGIATQLRGQAAREFVGSIESAIKNAGTFAELEGAIQAAQALESSGSLGRGQTADLKTEAQKRFSKIRAREEVETFVQGEGQGIVPLTPDHEDAMNAATDERGFVGAAAAVFQVKRFGRVSERTLEQMDSLATSVNGAQSPEAVAMWNAIAAENPAYAYQLTLGASSPLPEKLAVMAIDAQVRGVATLESNAAIPEETYDSAAAIYSKPPEGAEVRGPSLSETGFLFWGQPGQTVTNAEQQRAYRSIALSRMARAMHNGETDPAKLYRMGTAYAAKEIRKLYHPVKIAGETYAIRKDVAAFVQQTPRTFTNFKQLASEHMSRTSRLVPQGDWAYDFGQAREAEGNLVVPLLLDGETTNPEHWLEVPLSPIELDELVNPKIHPFNDTNRAFNRHSSFPAIGRWLYGDPDSEGTDD